MGKCKTRSATQVVNPQSPEPAVEPAEIEKISDTASRKRPRNSLAQIKEAERDQY